MTDTEALRTARTVLASLGVSIDDLLEATKSTSSHDAIPTVAAYVPVAKAAASETWSRTYNTYLDRLATSNLSETPLDQVRTSDLKAWAEHVQRTAVRRRNARTGAGAKDNAISAARYLFNLAVDDRLIPTSPAAKVEKPRKSPSPRRALTDDELASLAAVTRDGGNDPALDLLLLRFHLETGARRGGALGLKLGDIDARRHTIRLNEKGDTVRDQPVSGTLLRALEEHARSRGAKVQSDAVFRYRSGQPLTRRRYNTLTERWRKSLPWVAKEGVSPHWLRHTAITTVERLAGYAVAQAFAGHAPSGGSVTTTYIKAALPEVARVIQTLTGERHPLATPSAPESEETL